MKRSVGMKGLVTNISLPVDPGPGCSAELYQSKNMIFLVPCGFSSAAFILPCGTIPEVTFVRPKTDAHARDHLLH